MIVSERSLSKNLPHLLSFFSHSLLHFSLFRFNLTSLLKGHSMCNICFEQETAVPIANKSSSSASSI